MSARSVRKVSMATRRVPSPPLGGEGQGEVVCTARARSGFRDAGAVQTYPTLALPFERKGGDPPTRRANTRMPLTDRSPV